MKFVIEAHLPSGLRAVFQSAGHDAIHTLGLRVNPNGPFDPNGV